MGEIVPNGVGPEARFKQFLGEGKFMLQWSKTTGFYIFYPRCFEPTEATEDLEWVEASGDGVVYATTCTRRRDADGGDYNISLIDLAEGPRMMARVDGVAPDKVLIGMRVKARIEKLRSEPALVFSPAS